MLDNKLLGEIIISLACGQTIHEECFVELIRDLPLSPGEYSLLPECFCNDSCTEKLIPLNLQYFNKLLVKIFRNQKSARILPPAIPYNISPITPPVSTRSSIYSNINTPSTTPSTSISVNLSNLSPTLVKKSERLPNNSDRKPSRMSIQSIHSLAVASTDSSPKHEELDNLRFGGLIDVPKVKASKRIPSPLPLANLSENVDNTMPLSSTFAKFINSPLDNETNKFYTENDNESFVSVAESQIETTSLKSDMKAGKRKLSKRLRISKTFNDLLNSTNKTPQISHPNPELSLERNFTPYQLTSLSDYENDSSTPTTPTTTTIPNASITPQISCSSPEAPVEHHPYNLLKDSNIIAQTLQNPNPRITTFPSSDKNDETTDLSSSVLIYSVDSVTTHIPESNTATDDLRDRYIEQLMNNYESISFNKLVQYGELRLVDELLVSENEIDWYPTVVYLFKNFILIPLEDTVAELNVKQVRFSLNSPSVIKITADLESVVFFRAEELPVIEKWVIAISDTEYKFPLELLSSSPIYEKLAHKDSCSIYFEGEIHRSDESVYSDETTEMKIMHEDLVHDDFNQSCSEDSNEDSDNEIISTIMKNLTLAKA